MRAELNQEMGKWDGASGSAAGDGGAHAGLESLLPPPRGPYYLPPDLMALVVDFAAGGGIRMDRGRI